MKTKYIILLIAALLISLIISLVNIIKTETENEQMKDRPIHIGIP